MVLLERLYKRNMITREEMPYLIEGTMARFSIIIMHHKYKGKIELVRNAEVVHINIISRRKCIQELRKTVPKNSIDPYL